MTSKVVFLAVVPLLAQTDLDWKKLEQQHCLNPHCSQSTESLQPPNLTHGIDTDTKGQSGRNATSVLCLKVGDTSRDLSKELKKKRRDLKRQAEICS